MSIWNADHPDERGRGRKAGGAHYTVTFSKEEFAALRAIAAQKGERPQKWIRDQALAAMRAAGVLP